MRGENPGPSASSTTLAGSPPHARGKYFFDSYESILSGITPACAGKIFMDGLPEASAWDHPRMRGENYSTLNFNSTDLGSPPHARGKS